MIFIFLHFTNTFFYLSSLLGISFFLPNNSTLLLPTYSIPPHHTVTMSNQMQNTSTHASSSSSQASPFDHHQQQQPQPQPQPQPLSRYESQKKRDWNTFGQYLNNQSPPVPLSQCNYNHVLEFLRYLDQFGKTKVHLQTCIFFGQPAPPAPCACPLRQAWGSLDALIGRLRAAYEEHGGSPETNPFGGGAIRLYLREVKDCQAKARGIPYKKKKKKRNPIKGAQSAKAFRQLAS
ncbi:hypothetical protein RIF29_42040 [Crotalaria pallida]|uniref:ALOG domain-containing protein n=1 Tax=Crotalaria pallida TaxID=3830 RepID=A0AAN9E935_CROPI